jgi:lipopolysaccharide assembly outer membrane protein LptD (OstA)
MRPVKIFNFKGIAVSQPMVKKPDTAPSESQSRSWKLLFIVLLSVCTAARAQDQMKVKFSAEYLESGIISGEPCTILANNVVFGLEECTIKADNAIYYKDRKLIEAQGRVGIIYEDDGAAITADRLLYDEENHLAKLRGHVIYKSDGITFYTDHFDYDTETKQGYFAEGGRLIEGDNLLTSVCGQYNNLDKTAIFEREVTLTNPDYTLQCDRLRYNTVTKIAQFAGATKITGKDGKHTLTTHEEGEYNTSSQQSTFSQSKIETDAYILYGDLLRADSAAEIYTATGHVRLVAKEDDVTIVGDYGQYKKKEGTAEIHGNTLMTKVLEDDTLYLSADTFIATESKSTDDHGTDIKVRACHNVKFYKEDFQGKADSMVYESAGSSIYFDGAPIFWSYASQLTADSAYIVLRDKEFREMHMDIHALVISEDAAGNYNQLRGKSMVAFFKKNKIDSVEIAGNAESIYFVADDNRQLKGMHHIRCSQINVLIEEEAIAGITFQNNPVGVFYPLQKITEEARKLDTFHWRISERPTKKEVIEHGYGTEKAYKKFKLNQKR